MNLTETNNITNAKLDKVNGILHDVKILGANSRNGYSYSPDCRKNAMKMFEGIKVNLNHAKKGDANLESRFGKLVNISMRDDGLYTDLYYLTSHSHAKILEEASERMPDIFGMSINATGTSKKVDGKTIIESIDSITSVDLVSDPATVKGLFESEEPEDNDHYLEACLTSIKEIFDGEGDVSGKVRQAIDHLKKYGKHYGKEEEAEEEAETVEENTKIKELDEKLVKLTEEIHNLKLKSVVKEARSGALVTPVVKDLTNILRSI